MTVYFFKNLFEFRFVEFYYFLAYVHTCAQACIYLSAVAVTTAGILLVAIIVKIRDNLSINLNCLLQTLISILDNSKLIYNFLHISCILFELTHINLQLV